MGIHNRLLEREALVKKLNSRYSQPNKRPKLSQHEKEMLQSMVTQAFNAHNMIINNEECKRIIEFPYYVISSSGIVYRTIPLNNKELLFYILNPGVIFLQRKQVIKTKNRANRVSLTNSDGILVSVGLGKLVYNYFVGNNSKNFGVKHIDNNVNNCHYKNLELLQTKHSNVKLTRTKVNQIKRLIELKYSFKSIGLIYNVSKMTIGRINSGECWSKGGRKIPPKSVPFVVDNVVIRRVLSYYNFEKVETGFKMKFKVRRIQDTPYGNIIIGMINGYKITQAYTNITRAKKMVLKLNKYFEL